MVKAKDAIIVMVFVLLLFTFVFSLVATKHEIGIHKYDCKDLLNSLSTKERLPAKCNWMFCDYYQPSEIFNYYSARCLL